MQYSQQNNNIVFKTIGDLFHITRGAIPISNNIDGEYSFITPTEIHKTHNDYTHDCECILFIGRCIEDKLAKAHYFNGKFTASDSLYILTSKNKNEINYRYVWYYLNLNQKKHLSDDIYYGRLIKTISITRCSNIKIPMPPIELQNRIVENLDIAYTNFNKIYSDTMNSVIKHKEYIYRAMSFENKKVDILNNICHIDYGTHLYENENNIGRYPVISGNGAISFHTDSFNRQGFNVLIEIFGYSNKNVMLTMYNTFLNDAGFSIRPKINNVLHKFIGYYLYYNQDNISYYSIKRTAYKNIDMNAFKNLKIPIPSIKQQSEIIKLCDYKDNLVIELKKKLNTIDNNSLSYIMSHI